MKRLLTILALTMASVVMSCHPGRIYDERVSLAPEMVWDMNNVLEFRTDVADNSKPCDIKVQLRVVDFYPNSNMWLYIKIVSPSGASTADTMECMLRDEKGFSNSNSMKFGEVEDYEFTFKNDVKFAETGEYKFYLQHGMRMEKLPFVNEVGLIIDSKSE